MKASLLIVLTVAFGSQLLAEDWPGFRGPHNNGISDETDVPVEWSADENVVWKTALPGESNGSPIVSNGKVFLTSAVDEGKKRSLHCFDRRNGEELWVKTVDFDKKMPTHKTNQYGGSTPAADGVRVVVWHGSAGLYCYDFSGNELWSQDFGEFRHMWGYATSPIIYKDQVILHAGPGKEVFLASLDLESGETNWKTDEPVEGTGDRNLNKKYMGSWSTPVVTQVDGKDIIVCSFATRVNGYDPATGEIIWTCEGISGPKGDLAYTSPVIAGDICVAMGGFGGPAIGFRMEGQGNITEEKLLWREEKNPQRIGSGVHVDGYIYMANAGPAVIECIDPSTGEALWQERAPGGSFWGSTVYADGRLYSTNQQNTTLVFEPNPEEFKLIASNRIGERGNSTPAFSDGQIFIRTFSNLYCIGE